jgi:hypothetical protein
VWKTATSNDPSSSGRARASPSTNARLRRQRPRHGARPAPDLGDPRAWREDDVREIPLAHRLLLRIGRAKLEDLGQARDDGRIGLGDTDVDVRHAASLRPAPVGVKVDTARRRPL